MPAHDTLDNHPMVRLVSHCRRCRGWLLSPHSVADGIGPTCSRHEHIEQLASKPLTLFDFAA